MRERITTSAWVVSSLTIIFVVVFTYSLWAFSICFIYSRFLDTLSTQQKQQGPLSEIYSTAPYKILLRTFKPQVSDIDLLYLNIQERNFQTLSELVRVRIRIDPIFAPDFLELTTRGRNHQMQLTLLSGQLSSIKSNEESLASRFQSYLGELSHLLAQPSPQTEKLPYTQLGFYQGSLLEGLPIIPGLESGIYDSEELNRLLTIGKNQAVMGNPERQNFDPMNQLEIIRKLSIELQEELKNNESKKKILLEEIEDKNHQLETTA